MNPPPKPDKSSHNRILGSTFLFAIQQFLAKKKLGSILRNSGWLLFERVATIGLSLTIGIWVARYLGPTDFGALNYAIALVGTVNVFATLGLHGVVVRELVEKPEQAETVLGTTAGLRLIGSLFALLSIFALVVFLEKDETTSLLILVLSGTLLLAPLQTIEKWFDAQVQAKLLVVSRIVSLVFSAVARIALILTLSSVFFFGLESLLKEVLFVAVVVFICIKYADMPKRWKFDAAYARKLLAESWPLILSGFAATLFMRIDQVLLGELSTNHEVGIYSVAARLSEIWYMVPVIITRSILPDFVKTKEIEGQVAYAKRIQFVYDILFTLALGLALTTTFIATPLVIFLYGEAYAGAGIVLSVHIWAALFVFNGVASNNWLLTERLLRFPLLSHTLAALVNIVLNIIFIPKYGGIGAAVATLISYSITYYFAYFLTARTRPAAMQMTKAFTAPARILYTAFKYRYQG